jgi:hypothetical protein
LTEEQVIENVANNYYQVYVLRQKVSCWKQSNNHY